MFFMGVDPGKSGGVMVIDEDGYVTYQQVGTSAVEFKRFILDHENYQDIFSYVEKAQAMPKNGAVSMFNYGQGFGEILGVLIALEVPYELVPPSKWTKTMLAGVPADLDGKERARYAVERLFPKLDLRASERSKKPHEGLVDALLLAEYGRRRRRFPSNDLSL